ncbi:MAG TPA: hypothetical protein VFK44_13960 [Bacillales bacterium]|nr:hypothetical protein [Bacillales bacterium]
MTKFEGQLDEYTKLKLLEPRHAEALCVKWMYGQFIDHKIYAA